MITWVLGNGTSHRKWYGVKLSPSIGCNLAIKDFDLDHLVCVDRMAVVEVRRLKPKPRTTYWCKRSPLPVPENWQECEPAGIDSGSTAIKLAKDLYPDNEIICIGFDGVLGYSNDNAYSYHFRQKPTPERIRHKHRQAILNLLPECKSIRFVSIQKDPELETISYDQAFRIAQTQNRSLS